MKFTIGSHEFRVAKMNAVEVLALNSQVGLDTVEEAEKFFNAILERVEVKCGDGWLPVKEKGRSVFYPAGIDEDVQTIQTIVGTFMRDYLKPVFQKSNESI